MWSYPTVAKNKQLLPLAYGDLRQQRQQVVWHTLRILAHDAARMTPSRVEIPQQRAVELLPVLALLLRFEPLGIDVVGNHRLDSELGVTVGVCRAQRAVLGDRDHVLEARGIAVYGC